jgi:hypothetical protein
MKPTMNRLLERIRWNIKRLLKIQSFIENCPLFSQLEAFIFDH